MDKLIMENFRCFAGRHEVPLKPLTVLVGENSSGKSSFLAAVRLASDLVRNPTSAKFNEPPFELGAFIQLATHHGDATARQTPRNFGSEDWECVVPTITTSSLWRGCRKLESSSREIGH